MTAPLPDVKQQSLSPLVQPIQLPSRPKSARSHSRSSSSAGSFGRSEARRVSSKSAEFNKYTETDDEDYDDVFFAKPTGASKCPRQTMVLPLFTWGQRHPHFSSQRGFRVNRGLV